MNFRKILTFIFCMLLLVGCSQKLSSTAKTTLGDYNGISKDKKWSTSFKVYQDNKEVLLKGEVICVDKEIMKKFSQEDLKRNQITLIKENGLEFGGNFLYEDQLLNVNR